MLHAMLFRSGSFTVEEEERRRRRKISMKLIASLAPALAEIEAEVVAKADQNLPERHVT